MDDDAKLAAFFAASEPPARDPDFSTTVMARVARVRLRQDMSRLAVATVAGVAILWALAPSLALVMRHLEPGLAPAVAAIAVAAAVVVIAEGRGRRMLGLRS